MRSLAFASAVFGFLRVAEGAEEDPHSEYKFRIEMPPASQLKDTVETPLLLRSLSPTAGDDVILVPGMTYRINVTRFPVPPRLCTDKWSAVYTTTQTKSEWGGFKKKRIITNHTVPGTQPHLTSFRTGEKEGVTAAISIPLTVMSGDSVISTVYLHPGRAEISEEFKGVQLGRLAFSAGNTGGVVNVKKSSLPPQALVNALKGRRVTQAPKFENRKNNFTNAFPLLEVTITVTAR